MAMESAYGSALGNMNAPCSTEALNGRQPLEIGERSGSDDNPVFHLGHTSGGPSGSFCLLAFGP